MCGRYFNRRTKQELAEKMHAKKVFEEPLAANYNVAPATFQPIVRQQVDLDEREMVLARWGLVPFFAKTLTEFKGVSTFNARAEGIATAQVWRAPFERRRCLVPVEGFYEWQGLEGAKKAGRKPFAISLKSGEQMALAGLWDAWKEPKKSPQEVDRWLQSFSIITTEANELMATVHTRMPVILAERDWRRWLDRDVEAPPPIDLLRPYDSEEMQMEGCNPMVGNVRNNGPELLNSV